MRYKSFAAVTQNICPALSRYYYCEAKLLKQNKRDDDSNLKKLLSRCVFCCNKFSEGDRSVRIVPKLALNKKIKRLLKRCDTDSSSLGKFQTKLINDYIHSKNKLTITCNVCKKASKVDGISRDEKLKYDLRQKKKLKQKEFEDIKVLNKKEKKKEKKKLQRKRRAVGLTDEDVTAGLIIPEPPEPTPEWDNTDNRVNPRLPEAVEDYRTTTKSSTNSIESKELCEIGMVKGKDRSNITVSQGIVQRNTETKSQIQNKQAVIQIATKIGNKSVPKTLSSVQKRQNKKQKSKQMSQHLSNILKQEQKKETKGTLADFLSSI